MAYRQLIIEPLARGSGPQALVDDGLFEQRRRSGVGVVRTPACRKASSRPAPRSAAAAICAGAWSPDR
jgi:hypothetical protein